MRGRTRETCSGSTIDSERAEATGATRSRFGSTRDEMRTMNRRPAPMMEMGAKRMIFFVASCLPMREVADAARSSWVVWEKPCELDVGGGQRPTQPKAKPNPNRPAAPLSSLSLTTPATTDLVSSFHVRSSVRSSACSVVRLCFRSFVNPIVRSFVRSINSTSVCLLPCYVT